MFLKYSIFKNNSLIFWNYLNNFLKLFVHQEIRNENLVQRDEPQVLLQKYCFTIIMLRKNIARDKFCYSTRDNLPRIPVEYLFLKKYTILKYSIQFKNISSKIYNFKILNSKIYNFKIFNSKYTIQFKNISPKIYNFKSL